jgi:hypothetical protein
MNRSDELIEYISQNINDEDELAFTLITSTKRNIKKLQEKIYNCQNGEYAKLVNYITNLNDNIENERKKILLLKDNLLKIISSIRQILDKLKIYKRKTLNEQCQKYYDKITKNYKEIQELKELLSGVQNNEEKKELEKKNVKFIFR